jgi:ribosome-binding ATPase YchF (GTP1/OBG family)
MINEKDVERTIKKCNFDPKPMNWGDEELLRFATEIRKQSKPILIAANKIDLPHAKENFEKLKKEFPDYKIVPCCAEVELALRKADRAGIVKYVPGGNKFEILKTELPENQKKALEFMQKNILDVWGNTGIQQAINSTIFDLLDLMIIYAVQDPHKWVSGKGNLLPDTHLLKKGSNAIDLAGAIHTDFIDKFMGATDCRTHQNIGKEHTLKNDDIVAIKLRG